MPNGRSETETNFELDTDLMAELAALGAGAPAIHSDRVDMMPAIQESYEDRLVEAKRGLMAFETEALALRQAVFDLKIKDKNGQSQVAEWKAEAQKVVKRINSRVDEIIEKPKGFIQAVKNFAANVTAPLLEAKGEADRKYSIFAEYERQERRKQEQAAMEATRKLQAQIDKQAEKKGIDPVTLPLPAAGSAKIITRTDSGSTFEVTRWIFEITDPEKVDRKYCSPDQKKIRAAVEEGIREMAGVEIKEETKPQTRTR